MKQSIVFLEQVAYQLRVAALTMTTHAGSGHPSSCLSAADIMAVLFFHTMCFDPQHMNYTNNDRFILSKGHAAPLLYAAWKEAGVVTDAELQSYRQFGSPLEGHPTTRFKYAEAATGSLGMGLSIGAGQALAARARKLSYKTYVLLGDSEMAEGSIWEALEIARFYKLNNLIGIIDCNRLGQSTPTMEALEGDEAVRFKNMVEGFGCQAIIVDGHDCAALIDAFDQAGKAQLPVMIIARTKKGYGVSLMEDKEGHHGKPLSKEELPGALAELKKRFPAGARDKKEQWRPQLPTDNKKPTAPRLPVTLPNTDYKPGYLIATRKAYGQALCAAGKLIDQLVSLDAEVKNSTYAELFEKQFPDRFYQCFIAEQNMVSMAVGMDKRGLIPFVSTFGAFFTRAHDQIRMAAIGKAALRLVGSHAGVSIGQDGPSQMALEDIALMRCVPDSIVLYPSDAVSTHALVECMVNYTAGISYLRTTRMETPVIYASHEAFKIGGCKVIHQSAHDKALVIGAGVTLHEALKAYELLKKEGIAVAVIDLYSIKPLDHATIRALAHAANKNIVTVEDHYLQGGLGQAIDAALVNDGCRITNLAVTQLPQSGKPAELLAAMGIDAAAIIRAVKALL